MIDAPLPGDYYQSAAPVLSDWGKVINFSPTLYFAPKTIAELCAFLADMLSDKTGIRPVRILGGMHSCSHIVESDTVIDTSRLPLEFTLTPVADGQTQLVASAYMHAHEFLERASAAGVSLTALGGTDAQTMAGLISTNTAGATVHHSVYETIDWIDYLTVSKDGTTIVQERANKADPEFNALICSLGVVGFLLRIGFTLPPQRFFTAKTSVQNLADIVGDPAQTSRLNDFWRIEWVPETDWGLFWSANPLEGKGDPDGDYPPDKDESLLKFLIHTDEVLLKSGPFMNSLLLASYKTMKLTYSPVTVSGPMRHMIPIDRFAELHVAMAEWAFNPADLPKAMDVCRSYFGAVGGHWPNLGIEIQGTRTDSYFMSSWNWPGLDYIMKINFQYLTDYLSDAEKVTMITHLKGLWDALIAASIPFKPHWGKINFMDAAFVAKNYDLEAFKPYIQPLFLNDSMRKRLGV